MKSGLDQTSLSIDVTQVSPWSRHGEVPGAVTDRQVYISNQPSARGQQNFPGSLSEQPGPPQVIPVAPGGVPSTAGKNILYENQVQKGGLVLYPLVVSPSPKIAYRVYS